MRVLRPVLPALSVLLSFRIVQDLIKAGHEAAGACQLGSGPPQPDMVGYNVTRGPGSLCRQTRGAVVKIFLLGATGNSGRRILRLALQRAHEVTAFVRDETKLLSLVDKPIPPNLHVSIGDISKSADIARVMIGHDVAINAAGTVTEGSTFTQLVQTVVDSTVIS